MSKLKEHFNFHIVDVVSAHEAEKLEPDAADFVISTVPLKNCRLDYVVVSPLLSDEDYIRVGNKIDTLRRSRHLPEREKEEDNSPAKLMAAIRPVLQEEVPEKAEILEKKIRKVIREFYHQGEEGDEIFAPDLHHLLPPSHIQLDVEASDWKEAIRKAGVYLVEHEYIEPRYVDAMIANIEENGPYVVLSPGFAVPHEGVEMGSIKVGMNLIRLKTPVNFDAGEMDPVDFVCVLSAVDHKLHLKALFNLVNLLKTDGFKDALRKAATSEEAARVIEHYEYRLQES